MRTYRLLLNFLRECNYRYSPFLKIQVEKIGQNYLVTNKKFDPGLQDYYFFIANLLRQILKRVPKNKIIVFEVENFPQLFWVIPFIVLDYK
jgi:hypothetical protein